MITLTPEEHAEIVKTATNQLVKALITNHGQKVYLTKNQAAGLLDWSPQTVMRNLSHIDSTGNGQAVRFLLSDVEAELEKRRVRRS